MRASINFVEQCAGSYVQRGRQSVDVVESEIAPALLNARQVGGIKPSGVGQGLLRQPPCTTERCQVATEVLKPAGVDLHEDSVLVLDS